MRINNRNNDPVALNGENIEDVETFVYLSVTVLKEDGGTDDIKYRIGKAENKNKNKQKQKTTSKQINKQNVYGTEGNMEG